MSKVPSNGYARAKSLRSQAEETPIVSVRPAPAGKDFLPGQITQIKRLLIGDVGDEIAREAESVRTLEWPRFRGAFFQKVELPVGRAERLEDFEAGLRLAGFMASDQVLSQSLTNPTKFRVQKRGVAIDSHLPTPLQARRRGRAVF